MSDEMKMENWMKWAIGFGCFCLAVLLFYCAFLNHVAINEIGVAYDSIGGKVWVQSQPGWYFTRITVRVCVIPTVPIKVTIPSEAKVINTKIVRFNPDGIDEFIRLQGFSYFSDQSIENILMGYAFSGKEWPFMEVIQESGDETVKPVPLRK